MTTLAQIALPTIQNPVEFIVVAIGLIMLIALIVQLFMTRSIAPYMGMPAVVGALIMILFLVGGMGVNMGNLPAIVATILGFLVKLITSGFLWPYVIMIAIAQTVRIVSVAFNLKLVSSR